jgi:hypothetical protein
VVSWSIRKWPQNPRADSVHICWARKACRGALPKCDCSCCCHCCFKHASACAFGSAHEHVCNVRQQCTLTVMLNGVGALCTSACTHSPPLLGRLSAETISALRSQQRGGCVQLCHSPLLASISRTCMLLGEQRMACRALSAGQQEG